MKKENVDRLTETLHAILNSEEQEYVRRLGTAYMSQQTQFAQAYYATEEVRLAVRAISQNWEKVRQQEIGENITLDRAK